LHRENSKSLRTDTVLLLNMIQFARVVIYLGLSIVGWFSYLTWTPAPPYYIDGQYVPVMQFRPFLPTLVLTLILLFRAFLAQRLWFFGSRMLGVSAGADFVEIMVLSAITMGQIEFFGFNVSISLFLVMVLLSTTSIFLSILPKTQHLFNIRQEPLSEDPSTSGGAVFTLGVFLLVINGLIAFLTSVFVATSQWPLTTVWTFPVLPWAVILLILFVSNSIAAIGVVQKYNWSYHFAMFVSVISIIWGFFTIPTSILAIFILMTHSFRSEFLSVNNGS
jgi:hypothetical protein